jgi:hypothetical protein
MATTTAPRIIGTLRLTEYGTEKAEYWRDSVYAKEDFRYWAIYEYLKLSPSFFAVLKRIENKRSPYPLPADADAVEQVVKDFRHIFRMEPWEWWRKHGKHLFGVAAPAPQVVIAGALNEKHKALNVMWDKNDAIVARIAICQSKQEALKQLEKELDRLIAKGQFSTTPAQEMTPKYVFQNNRIRESTLAIGGQALTCYCGKRLLPLWWIGNFVGITPGQCITEDDLIKVDADEIANRKRVLGIATSRLIRSSLLIAENAARGRFPCADPFPEALTSVFQRSAGRPTRNKTPKPKTVGADDLTEAWK